MKPTQRSLRHWELVTLEEQAKRDGPNIPRILQVVLCIGLMFAMMVVGDAAGLQ